MEELAPETVGVAAGFRAAGEMALGGHVAVIRAVAAGGVLVAVTNIEDLKSRICQRLAAGAPSPGHGRAIGEVLAHRRGPCGTG